MENLKRSDVLLIFTYAPAGLGHLRVTSALYDGLPEGVSSVLLGAEDTKITYWHRLMSVNPLLRKVMEWFQQEKNERWFYPFYIWTLKNSTGHLYRQMEHLVSQQWHEKKIVVVISTHFGLAHQMAKIRNRLEKNLKIKLVLVVQVTDATSMKIWYVAGADLITVPSEKVKTELMNYALKKNLEKAEIVVLSYPLSQTLEYQLDNKEYELRLNQYKKDTDTKIKIVIPISGAAVGLAYFDKLISRLAKSSERFRFYLVISNNLHTKVFINKMKARNYITVIENSSDRKVVDSYEKLYQQEVIALEIVKPSEQAFKALLTPSQRGGSILLLTQAVGKQEQDNLKFMLDHKLLADREDQDKLQEYALENKLPDEKDCQPYLERAHSWKALRLTNDPNKDAVIINWCIKAGVFEKMAGRKEKSSSKDPELGSNGVQQFWEKVDNLTEKIV